MKCLHIDALNSGASGDMLLAALLKLAPNPEDILRNLIELKDYLPGVKKLNIELIEIERHGILVNQLKIDLIENKDHRSAKQMQQSLQNFLDAKSFSKSAREYAINVLETLILAETEVHGKAMDKIHLHELSSVDTLIDILGTTMALEQLNLLDSNAKILCTELPVGGGTIKGAHGLLPVPAPATTNILKKSNLIIIKGPIKSELVTPTGASLLTNLNPNNSNLKLSLEKVAYSTGQKRFDDFLNILTLYYGELEENYSLGEFQKYLDSIILLETNVDDISGEIIGDFVSRLNPKDFLDIQVIPSLTKKNRPSYIIQVLCNPGNEKQLLKSFFTDLGTLGVRIRKLDRVCIDRSIDKIQLDINGIKYPLDVKISYLDLENTRIIVNIKPEYEDLKAISLETGKSVREIQSYALEHLNSLKLKEENKKN